jgi:predicted RNA methylase
MNLEYAPVKSKPSNRIKEFGDFQTPPVLANAILTKLRGSGLSPVSILEPTCGTGSFVLAAFKVFPLAKIFGLDINSNYISDLKTKIDPLDKNNRVFLDCVNFFDIDWTDYSRSIKPPFLIVGNLPWVTSSELGKIDRNNLPVKSNIHKFKGLDSLTGKSNFDISEWMILELLKASENSPGTMAILCKMSVARKVFKYAIINHFPISSISMHRIDAEFHFKASIDACLLTMTFETGRLTDKCSVFSSLDSQTPTTILSIFEGFLINDHASFETLKHLHGKSFHTWRSGIKHDAAKIMEIFREGTTFRNGFNEIVDIESDYLFPLLKSSDIAHGRVKNSSRVLIVTQRLIGDDTSIIQTSAPKLWEYLNHYRNKLDSRASSIYKTKPPFSIFGIGPYTFTLWKIAISGFHKKLQFQLVGPIDNKPVVFDDTCYFLPATNREEALILLSLLTHPKSIRYFDSLIYWKAKRPITKQILQQVNLRRLFLEVGEEYIRTRISEFASSPVDQKLANYFFDTLRQDRA